MFYVPLGTLGTSCFDPRPLGFVFLLPGENKNNMKNNKTMHPRTPEGGLGGSNQNLAQLSPGARGSDFDGSCAGLHARETQILTTRKLASRSSRCFAKARCSLGSLAY